MWSYRLGCRDENSDAEDSDLASSVLSRPEGTRLSRGRDLDERLALLESQMLDLDHRMEHLVDVKVAKAMQRSSLKPISHRTGGSCRKGGLRARFDTAGRPRFSSTQSREWGPFGSTAESGRSTQANLHEIRELGLAPGNLPGVTFSGEGRSALRIHQIAEEDVDLDLLATEATPINSVGSAFTEDSDWDVDGAPRRKSSLFRPFYATAADDTMAMLDERADHGVEELALPQDMWGATAFMLVYDLYPWLHPRGQEHHHFFEVAGLRAFGILGLHMLCMGVQVYLTIVFQIFVVRPEVAKIQELYFDWHAFAFKPDGSFNRSIAPEFEAGMLAGGALSYEQVCGSAFANPHITTCVMLLWIFRMFGEFNATITFGRIFQNLLPFTADDTCTDIGYLRDDGFRIEKVPLLIKALIFLLVFCPKAFVAIATFMAGMVWLATAQSFEQLIMNALALEFIISIDEMFFNNLVPRHYGEMVARCSFAEHEGNQTASGKRIMRRWVIHMSLICGMVCVVFTYFHGFQTVLPHFQDDMKQHCDFFGQHYQQFCDNDACVGSFCLIGDDNCFPYGTQQSAAYSKMEGFLVKGKKPPRMAAGSAGGGGGGSRAHGKHR